MTGSHQKHTVLTQGTLRSSDNQVASNAYTPISSICLSNRIRCKDLVKPAVLLTPTALDRFRLLMTELLPTLGYPITATEIAVLRFRESEYCFNSDSRATPPIHCDHAFIQANQRSMITAYNAECMASIAMSQRNDAPINVPPSNQTL